MGRVFYIISAEAGEGVLTTMKKKLMCLLLAAAMVIPSVPAQAAASSFVDVPEGAYYYDAVLWAVENEITTGWLEDQYAPEMACTRGQIVTFLYRAMDGSADENAECNFVDVPKGAYYYEAVLWAVENGITTGWTADEFAPEMACTRGQIVTFLYRAMDGEVTDTNADRFSDVPEGCYCDKPVLWAVENGITTGWLADEFAPEMACTRGQIATFLYRALKDGENPGENPGEKPDDTVNNGTSDDPNAYAIYPIPQSVAYEEGSFTLSDVEIVAEESVDEATLAFLEEVLEDYEVAYTTADQITEGKTQILLGVEGSDGIVDTYADDIAIEKEDLYEQNDAYLLKAEDGCIVIEGKDADSVFYGVATLQMMFSSFDGDKFLNAQIEDFATVASRGYIEGFYGAWNFQEREDLMRFARDYKMNSYVYAAKGDAYHTNKWADLYPADTLAELENLVKVGEETKVTFGWSIHLGSFFNKFSTTADASFATNYAKLTAKLDQLIGIGVRRIDVLNDDFGSGSHAVVVEVLNMINSYLKENGCEPLTYCPQGYNEAWSGNGAELAELKNLDEDIKIYWTGADVNSPITQSTVDFLRSKTNHEPDYWLNYPVNEHAKSGVFLGDITYYARDNVTGLAGFHSNPSRYAYSNEVGLYQLAALVWNNNNYSEYAQEVWESAFDYLQPEVKDSYFKIASNISNAPNSSRVPGFNESEYLAETLEAAKAAITSGASLAEDVNVQGLLQEFKDITAAIADFRANCANQSLVSELDPWLNSLDDLAAAGAAALESLIAMENNDASTGWEKLSVASQRYDTAYTYRAHPTDLEGTYAKAGTKRLSGFISLIVNEAKNQLTPILNPDDTTANPSVYAVIAGTAQTDDANGKKMYDGDLSTAATWNQVAQAGDYYGLDLGRVVPVKDIEIIQGSTDNDHDIFWNGVLQYSEDGENWTEIEDAEVTLNSHQISVEGLEIKARYVRYYLTEVGGNPANPSKKDFWTHVREFTVNKEVPEYDRVYTNVEELKETPLTLEGAEIGIRDLENLTLEAGEYIGVKLVKPAAAVGFVKEISNETGLALEFSYNGSWWTAAEDAEGTVGAKYLRLINHSDSAVTTDVTKIAMNMQYLEAEPTVLTTTLAGGIADGKYENVFDGDLSSYVLTGSGQTKDSYVTFDLGKTIEVYDVTVVTTDGAQRLYNAKVQVSADNVTWEDVAVVSNDDSVFEVPYRYVRGDGEGTAARYLRIYITAANSNALKLHEIQLNKTAEGSMAAAEVISSLNGNLNAVSDKNIATAFTAEAKDGDYLEYRISGSTNVKQVSVLQGTAGKGEAFAVKADGTEVSLGELDQSAAVFDTKEIAPITAVRIRWSEAESVAIHEITASAGAEETDDIGVYVDPIVVSGGEAAVTNLAHGKTVTVSGTSDGNKDNVNDGDTNTKWDSNAIKDGSGADTDDSWIYIDLGSSKEVHQVIVHFFNKIYPTSWVVQVSDDAENWTDASEELTMENNGATHPIETVSFEEPVNGRYVRLYFNTLNTAAAGHGVGVKEFEIYGR